MSISQDTDAQRAKLQTADILVGESKARIAALTSFPVEGSLPTKSEGV